MKAQALLFSTFVSAALSAPAIVWKNSRQRQSSDGSQHRADVLTSTDLLVDAFQTPSSEAASSSSLDAVVFLLGKDADGTESLRKLAGAGELPLVSGKYDDADAIYHHVSGIESIHTVSREAEGIAKGSKQSVLSVTLDEFNTRMEGQTTPAKVEVAQNGVLAKSKRYSNKRIRALADADVLIVNIDPKQTNAADIDSGVVKAIESNEIENVVLASIRGLEETKYEREVIAMRKLDKMHERGARVLNAKHRRLDQEEQDGENNNANNANNNAEDTNGVYFVSMTPNIFAGILFFFLFTFITLIGMTCMGAIASQDVYVSKMPAIGREA